MGDVAREIHSQPNECGECDSAACDGHPELDLLAAETALTDPTSVPSWMTARDAADYHFEQAAKIYAARFRLEPLPQTIELFAECEQTTTVCCFVDEHLVFCELGVDRCSGSCAICKGIGVVGEYDRHTGLDDVVACDKCQRGRMSTDHFDVEPCVEH